MAVAGRAEAQSQSLTEQVTYIKSTVPHSGAQFSRIAVSDDWLVVGAPEDSVAAPFAGAVHVFKREGEAWVPDAVLTPTNGESPDRFGWSVSVLDSTIAVGAVFESSSASGVGGDPFNNGLPFSGAVYIFERIQQAWVQTEYIKAINPGQSENFGVSVALAGDRLFAGAHDEGSATTFSAPDPLDDSAHGTGAVYVYNRSSGAWVHELYLKAPTLSRGFGFSLNASDDGNRLTVGAPYEIGAATLGVGAVHEFQFQAGLGWSPVQSLTPSRPESQYFGWSVSVNGPEDLLVVGAPKDWTFGSGIGGLGPVFGLGQSLDSGAAYVYELGGTGWTELEFVKAPEIHAFQDFGVSVAAGDDFFAVGAPGDAGLGVGVNPPYQQDYPASEGTGAVYRYEIEGSVVLPADYLKAHNAEVGDRFGFPLAVGGSGLLVSAPYEESLGAGIDGCSDCDTGSEVGAVYEFDLDGPTAALESTLLGANVATLTAGSPALGSTWCLDVDQGSVGATSYLLTAFLQPAATGPFFGDQWILAGPQFPSGEILGLSPVVTSTTSQHCYQIPASDSLYGRELHVQAFHFGCPGCPRFSNALRLVLGN